MSINADTVAWPGGPVRWIEPENDRLCISVPFTWDLAGIHAELRQGDFQYSQVLVGGPATDLMPHYFDDLPHVECGPQYPDVLQRVHPLATRTTYGCTRRCGFCGIGRQLIEPGPFHELPDWPDLPIICDNNLLAASDKHIARVCERLARHQHADFNQGLDARLLTQEHANMIAQIKKPICRLSFDSIADWPAWERAYDRLRAAGLPKSAIRAYVMIGYDSGPLDAWQRCHRADQTGVHVCPMWYHALDAELSHAVSQEQSDLGWSDKERMNIMQWHWQRSAKYGGPPAELTAPPPPVPLAFPGS